MQDPPKYRLKTVLGIGVVLILAFILMMMSHHTFVDVSAEGSQTRSKPLTNIQPEKMEGVSDIPGNDHQSFSEQGGPVGLHKSSVQENASRKARSTQENKPLKPLGLAREAQGLGVPMRAKVVMFNACDNSLAFSDFMTLFRKHYPFASVSAENFNSGWGMPRTRIYFLKDEMLAGEIADWLPGDQDMIDFHHQDGVKLPESEAGPFLHMAIDETADVFVFLGNDYRNIMQQLAGQPYKPKN